MVRYRLPAGSVPPLTDVIGHLLADGPTLRVRTKRGDVVERRQSTTWSRSRRLPPRRCAPPTSATSSMRRRWHGRGLSSSGWAAGCCRFGHGSTQTCQFRCAAGCFDVDRYRRDRRVVRRARCCRRCSVCTGPAASRAAAHADRRRKPCHGPRSRAWRSRASRWRSAPRPDDEWLRLYQRRRARRRLDRGRRRRGGFRVRRRRCGGTGGRHRMHPTAPAGWACRRCRSPRCSAAAATHETSAPHCWRGAPTTARTAPTPRCLSTTPPP